VKDRLVLVGFMGSGKSTVGRRLARLLDFEFLDLDSWIETRAGLAVRQIFAERGEEGFRAEELAAAREIQTRSRLVVAAGGGAFTQAETRAALSHRALTVFLRCDLEAVLRRVRFDGSRPLAVSRERIGVLFRERQPSYRLAELEVDATAPPEAVAREIVRAFREAGAAQLRTKG